MIHIPFLFTYSSMQPIIWQQLNAFTHTDMDKTQVHSEHQTGGKISRIDREWSEKQKLLSQFSSLDENVLTPDARG